MDLLAAAWQFIGNLDNELALLLLNYGPWIYLILFLIVFCETGLVVAPFLPGDSLLFASGALWAAAEWGSAHTITPTTSSKQRIRLDIDTIL